MKINVFSIVKNDSFQPIYQDFIKQCKSFNALLCLCDIFTPLIAKAQKQSCTKAQKSYTQAFLPYLSQGENFALHPRGKMLDSLAFSKLLEDKREVCFFIGGAYGFEEEFLKHTQVFSLSPMTFSHQIAKLVLCEQIYRGLSIVANHPYHK